MRFLFFKGKTSVQKTELEHKKELQQLDREIVPDTKIQLPSRICGNCKSAILLQEDSDHCGHCKCCR